MSNCTFDKFKAKIENGAFLKRTDQTTPALYIHLLTTNNVFDRQLMEIARPKKETTVKILKKSTQCKCNMNIIDVGGLFFSHKRQVKC